MPTTGLRRRALQTLVSYSCGRLDRQHGSPPDGVEGVAGHLSRLIDYVRHRSANRQHLPSASHNRGSSLTLSNPAGLRISTTANPPPRPPRPGYPHFDGRYNMTAGLPGYRPGRLSGKPDL